MLAEGRAQAVGAIQRREQRFEVVLPGWLRTGALTLPVEIKDISCGGASAEAPCPLDRDSRVRLSREKLNVAARVTWTRGRRFGLCFEAPISAIDLFVQLSHNRALSGPSTKSEPLHSRA